MDVASGVLHSRQVRGLVRIIIKLLQASEAIRLYGKIMGKGIAVANFRDFKFDGPKIGDIDLPRLGHEIGVGEDVIHAVMDTETSGSSTDRNGRIKALYEPHVAYRNSSGAVRDKLVAAGLAYRSWGEKPYPKDSHPRIKRAMEIDETVALLATSWGLPQVLGENFALAGYDSVQGMVLAMLGDERLQLAAMVDFISNAGLGDELRVIESKLKRGLRITADDARPFVRGYNGAQYAKNDYHNTFADAVNRWAKIPDTPWAPSGAAVGVDPSKNLYDGEYHPEVRAVQSKLDDIGYPEVGTVDGIWGSKTRAAVLAFRADNGMVLEPTIDNSLMAALMTSENRPVSAARAEATIEHLREKGVPDVKAADLTQVAGGVAAAGGGVAAAGKALDQVEEYSGLAQRAADLVAPVVDLIADNLWLILVGVGVIVVYQSGVLKSIRLDKHRTGRDVSQ